MLADSILNHFEYYTRFQDRNHVRVLLPKEKIASTIREIYSRSEEFGLFSDSETSEEDILKKVVARNTLEMDLDKTQLETYALMTALNLESFEM